MMSIRTRAGASQVAVLWRAFFAQFLTSETATSDIELRRSMFGVLAFLLPPGMYLVLEVFPQFHIVVAVSRALHRPAMIDDFIVRMGFALVTFSMVTVGFIGVYAWDALAFDRRDAMVLGPLPLRGVTIIAAKLGALAAFLACAASVVNLPTVVLFALTTSGELGTLALVTHLVAHLAATIGGATFVFAAIVTIRGTAACLCGSGAAARVGLFLQFLFVSALLWFAILVPTALHTAATDSLYTGANGSLPTAWFLGLFEYLRGSPRPEFVPLARRALLVTTIAVVSGVLVSVAGYRRQMQLALTSSARPDALGGARLTRTLARLLVGRNQLAKATSEFILLTIARNRAQQAPIAFNVAIGLAIVIAGLSRSVTDLASLMHPRTAVLWIPLLLAYWAAIGLRASFFLPSELSASWSFHTNAPEETSAYWVAVRATTIALVAPPTLFITALFAAIYGWRVAASHALLASAIVALLAEVIALTVDFIPFTRAYQPGHARLKTLWWLYILGIYVFAYWPTRLELRFMDGPLALLEMVGGIVVGIFPLDLAGRRKAVKWTQQPHEEPADAFSSATVLDLGGAIRRTAV